VACKYVGLPDRFADQRCPKCNKREFKIVPRSDSDVDEVGAEAFVEDAPLLDDIERSFSKAKPRKSAADQRPGPEKPVQHSPDERDADPRPVLARQKWTTPKVSQESETSVDKQVGEKPVKKSVKQLSVTAKTRPRYTIELPPKVQQVLRWSALGLPVVVVVIVALVLFGGGTGRRARPRVPDSAGTVDPAALEAQAMALYNAAVEYYRSGKVEESVATLQSVVSLFPLTNVGSMARQALDRVNQGMRPFDDQPAVANATTRPAGQPDRPADAPVAASVPKKKSFIGVRRSPAGDEGSGAESADGSSSPSAAATPKAPAAPAQGSTLAKTSATARALPDGFVAVAESGVDSSGWPIEIICLKDQSHMMLVPAGEFEMGNANGEPNVRTVHRVRLKAYYIDRYEITLTQYKHFLEQRRLKGTPYRDLSAASLTAVPSDRHPVVGLAWRDANAYAEWSGKTLPTEAQWEKAARGTDRRLFPWGTGQPNWEKPRQPKQIDRVGSFAWDVSIYGCFDMAGNAWEWCADWYAPNAYDRNFVEDPEGPKTAPPPVAARDPEKVIRGGSAQWEVTWRSFGGIQDEPLHVGFRCALEIEKLVPRTPPLTVVTESPRDTQPQAPTRIPPGGYKF
jgi:formylglycine-generating enzyme required for sulfatase activity